MRLISMAALAVVLLAPGGAAFARETAQLRRIDAQTVELTRTAGAPVDVWLSADAAFDKNDQRVAQKTTAANLRVALPAARRGYVILRDAAGEITVVGERTAPLAQGSNFRDLGGYPAAGGKHVRWGKIFRSGATPLLSDADLAQVQSIGLSEMIDLRSVEERQLAPSRIAHVPYSAIGYSMMEMMPSDPAKLAASGGGELYGEMPGFLAPHVRLVFNRLLGDRGPIVYNCSAGQDRTGLVSALVLSALGVPRETILEDYHLSTAMRRPEFEMPRLDPAAHGDNPVVKMFAGHQGSRPKPLKMADGTAYLTYAFAAIDKKWGSVDAYLEKEAGVSAQDIAALRATYLE